MLIVLDIINCIENPRIGITLYIHMNMSKQQSFRVHTISMFIIEVKL